MLEYLGLALLSSLIVNIAAMFFLIRSNFLKFNGNFAAFMQKYQEDTRSIHTENINILLALQHTISENMKNTGEMQQNQLKLLSSQLTGLTSINESKLEKIRETVDNKLQSLITTNYQKLEEMRLIVDEKLHSTLEKRLGESFKLVSDRLESVHQGLGEMQNLASGVGDLKKVLSNVKTRGTWGEVQLEAIITQLLTQAQYEKNVALFPDAGLRVEFAIKLPHNNGDLQHTWLPIDAKFPIEDYHKLLEAQEQANTAEIAQAAKALEANTKKVAKLISEKYIKPPFTTDFAILFIPVEGLYAEILRIPGLMELLQNNYRIIITSPTTLSAILNSLQMGFRTLAIEQRSGEVWNLLSSVKTEFLKFSDILAKTKLKLEQASKTIGDAEVRSRSIHRHLKDVQEVKALSPASPSISADVNTSSSQEDVA